MVRYKVVYWDSDEGKEYTSKGWARGSLRSIMVIVS